jgi:hypothetical protein
MQRTSQKHTGKNQAQLKYSKLLIIPGLTA